MLPGRGSASEVTFGTDLRHARLPPGCIKPNSYGRIVVTDASGKRAWSNPFWLDHIAAQT